MPLDLITLGDATIDTFLVIEEGTGSVKLDKTKTKLQINYADKICVTHTAQSVGGNAANVAVGTRKIGLKTAIITEIGDDINGHVIMSELKKAKVNTKMVKMLPHKETRYSIILNYHSERTVFSAHVKRRYTLPKFPATRWIYYTSMGASFKKVQQKLRTHLRKNNDILLAHNPGSHQLKHGLPTIKKILPRTHILFVNKQEAAKFVGKKSSIQSYMRALHKLGPQIVVLTDGTKGSYASNGVNTYHMTPYNIKAKAKTGAGDAYTSGFLSAMILGKSVPVAMQWGTANAAGVIQEFGAQKGLLTKTTIQKIIRTHKKTKPTQI